MIQGEFWKCAVHAGVILKQKFYHSSETCLTRVSESLQLSILSPTFSRVGVHCWFCLQYGRWTCWVTGIFKSVSAFQPHQAPAYIPPVWHPAAQGQRRQLQNPLLVLEVQFPALAGKQVLNPSLTVTIHAFSVFLPWLTQLWKTKYSKRPEQGAGLRAQSAAPEDGTGMTAGWADSCTGTPSASLVCFWGTRGAQWSEGEMVWATGALLLSPATVVGGSCPTLETATPQPDISWAHLDEAEGFFTGYPMGSVNLRRPPFCYETNGWKKSWLQKASAPLLMACSILKYPGITSEWAVPDPALGWNREVCCLCHLKRKSFKLVGGQQQAWVLGAVYSRLCAAEADTMELSQSWG